MKLPVINPVSLGEKISAAMRRSRERSLAATAEASERAFRNRCLRIARCFTADFKTQVQLSEAFFKANAADDATRARIAKEVLGTANTARAAATVPPAPSPSATKPTPPVSSTALRGSATSSSAPSPSASPRAKPAPTAPARSLAALALDDLMAVFDRKSGTRGIAAQRILAHAALSSPLEQYAFLARSISPVTITPEDREQAAAALRGALKIPFDDHPPFGQAALVAAVCQARERFPAQAATPPTTAMSTASTQKGFIAQLRSAIAESAAAPARAAALLPELVKTRSAVALEDLSGREITTTLYFDRVAASASTSRVPFAAARALSAVGALLNAK